jgi:hypothetical protein
VYSLTGVTSSTSKNGNPVTTLDAGTYNTAGFALDGVFGIDSMVDFGVYIKSGSTATTGEGINGSIAANSGVYTTSGINTVLVALGFTWLLSRQPIQSLAVQLKQWGTRVNM